MSRLSEAEYHTKLLFQGQRTQILPEARSDMNMTLREVNGQIRSHRMEPYHRNQEYEASRRAQGCPIAELQNRERAQQDDRVRTIQEMKELKDICCVLRLRVQESRTDEFSREEWRGSQSTVNQANGSNSGTARLNKIV